MIRKKIWLCTSIFCKEQEFSTIINFYIKPFLCSNAKIIYAYLIELSCNEEPQIRFSLLSNDNLTNELQLLLDAHFRNVLINSKATKYFKSLVKQERDFCQIEVQHGLYSIFYKKQYSLKHYEIQMGVSNLILEIVSSELINDESRAFVALCLHLGYIYSLRTTYEQDLIEKPLMDFYNNMSPLKLQTIPKFSKNYLCNRDMVNQMYLQITNDLSSDLLWLEEWISLCKRNISGNYSPWEKLTEKDENIKNYKNANVKIFNFTTDHSNLPSYSIPCFINKYLYIKDTSDSALDLVNSFLHDRFIEEV